MGKTNRLKGIPGNLALSYLSTVGYSNGGYMADWLYFIASEQKINQIEINILNGVITPKEADEKPLRSNLSRLRKILKNDLASKGFDMDFVKDAVLVFEIPFDHPRLNKLVYSFPYIRDVNGILYRPKKAVIECAYELNFNPRRNLGYILSNIEWSSVLGQLMRQIGF